METLNQRFVELTKAYKALTDEEIRNNYLQYGHPDGKQSYSIGIALPKLIVEEGSGKYVLMLYASLLGILLPYIVGRWWYGSQRYTREKVLAASAGNMFREYEGTMIGGPIVNALSTGEEYNEMLSGPKAEAGLAKIEKKVFALDEKTFSSKDRDVLRKIDNPVRRKALALLWAYLNRIDLEDPVLNEGLFPLLCAFRPANMVCRKVRGRIDCSFAYGILHGNCAGLWQPNSHHWRLSDLSMHRPGHLSGIVTAPAAAIFYTQSGRVG